MEIVGNGGGAMNEEKKHEKRIANADKHKESLLFTWSSTI